MSPLPLSPSTPVETHDIVSDTDPSYATAAQAVWADCESLPHCPWSTCEASLTKLLWPKSLAVVGASHLKGTIGQKVLTNIMTGGFEGAIYPINPKYAGESFLLPDSTDAESTQIPHPPVTFLGSISDLPTNQVDMAVIITPARTVAQVIRQLGEQGVKSVVVISSGFDEIGGDGHKLAQDVANVLKQLDMTMVGPNCVGVLNTHAKLNATFCQETPIVGKGAIISQSGAVGIDLINRARRLGLGIGHFISLGNQMDVNSARLLAHWRNDPSVGYVMGYLESINDPAAIRLLSWLTRKKPILTIKSGKSSAGAKAASSHTGSMAGNDTAVETLFNRTGIMRVNSIQQLFAAAQAFEFCPPSMGNRVAIFSNAGGYAVMGTDYLETAVHLKSVGLTMAEFSPDTQKTLSQTLSPMASCKNPVDVTAAGPFDNPRAYQDALRAVLADPEVDSALVAIVPVLDLDTPSTVQLIAEVAAEVQKPVVAMVSCSETDLAQSRSLLQREGIPQIAIYGSMEEGIVGLALLEKHRQWQVTPAETHPHIEGIQPDFGGVAKILKQARREQRSLLTTVESLDILKLYGIPTPRYALATTLEMVCDTAETIGYPVVLKLNSKTCSHKTDVGGVIVNIQNREELVTSFETLMASLKSHDMADFQAGEGILVQQCIKGLTELLFGITSEPSFGKLIVAGRGGIYTNLEQDVSIALAPLSLEEIRRILTSNRVSPILQGYRGKSGINMAALEDVLMRLSQLAEDFPEIDELDINPFIALSEESGSDAVGVAVDARIILT